MNTEIKQCQNCKNRFTIEPEDFDFYEKINVPPPTFCPECRTIRRMVWRNERSLYKRKCDLCGQDIISIYPSQTTFPVYCHDCWWSDKWGTVSYGRDYDFSKPFFGQMRELLSSVPRAALQTTNAVNSVYANATVDVKNGYFVFGGHDSENLLYSNQNAWVKDSADLSFCERSELCYEAFQCDRCSRLSFSSYCAECIDSAFLLDCTGCQNCFLCVGQRNKEYCILNRQYPKEEYQKRMKEFERGSYAGTLRAKEEFKKLALSFPRKFIRSKNAVNSTGDDLTNVKNCRHCFASREGEDCAYSFFAVDTVKDAYDTMFNGVRSERTYEVMSVVVASDILFSSIVWNSNNVSYSDNCFASQNLFGCTALRNKEYCILDKQYSKEGYEALVPKIIEHAKNVPYADSKGRIYKYGEFFPVEASPFAYNETVAQEYYPLTKEEALRQGFRWKDPDTREYKVTIPSENLPDHVKDAPDSILNEIIGCAHKGQCNEQCTTAFKIIPQELESYRRMNLPLPRLCPNCRHCQRIKQRNPLKLWHRKCQCDLKTHFHGEGKCPNEFETSYAPDRPEIVYCEECYNREIS